MSYKIGSFNVRNLSFGAGVSRDLDLMADLIREFDLIALQEVLSEGKILQGPSLKDVSGQAKAYEYSLKSRLGDNWDMCWLDPKTKWTPYKGDDQRGEGYAFLWRKDKFKCPRNENDMELRPKIIHHYRPDSSKNEIRLIRDPGYGRFQFVNMPNAEIRVITTHIVYNKPDQENLKKVVEHGAFDMRRNEFNILARSIYTSVCDDHNDINCVVPYTILLGDYNLNLLSSGAGAPYVPPLVVIDSEKNILPVYEMNKKGHYRLHTVQKDLSTVNKDSNGYASNYDHFTYDDRTRDGIVLGDAHTINAVKRAGDFKTYKEKISDHIPVMLEIDFK